MAAAADRAQAATITLYNVQYTGNYAYDLGGGMLSYVSVSASNSRFENNRSVNNWGGGFFADQTVVADQH